MMYRMLEDAVRRRVRRRRGAWYMKRPRYYRHSDDLWTRRNWRVNQMRVWGKRHQLSPLSISNNWNWQPVKTTA